LAYINSAARRYIRDLLAELADLYVGCNIDGLLTAKPMLGRSLVFTPKQVFGPRTDKSQPIWIQFRTHLLLYGIHLWADLDRDAIGAWAAPGQTRTTIFCNTCNAPSSYSFTPNQWYRWKAETLKLCLLLARKVCDRHLADI